MNGINIFNPVEIEREYYLKVIDYAIKNRVDFFQINGPIHDPVKGNIDGMIFYRKYAQFNKVKDSEYVKRTVAVVNDCMELSCKAGIKTYIWHHELELPTGFEEAYPETLNADGDIEVSHPLVKDFLENKIEDFFYTYPKADGIVLTLHETRIPLLKLKNQKLGKVERVKYITEILYNACVKLGKELIVRPFASVEEDYEMMMDAYAKISEKLVVMDKWTQFDWSLCLPHNGFFNRIKKNPLMVEADIFGEFFGKGFLPLMLKDHILEKVRYCKKFSPIGFCARVDRNGFHPFGSVQEVNLRIMQACLNGDDADAAIDGFFREKYGEAGGQVRALMENTEDLQKKIFYLNGYYFTELSCFPCVNHCKNHFYFEMMKNDYRIASNEWFIPKNWSRGTIEDVLDEKRTAVSCARLKLNELQKMRNVLSAENYAELENKFQNLYYVARLWFALTRVFIAYANENEAELLAVCEELTAIEDEAKKTVTQNYYVTTIVRAQGIDPVAQFVKEVKASFYKERETAESLQKRGLTDFVVCGGGLEGHKLQKEVNFSDTYVFEDGVCRIPGTNKGKDWSTVNAHGWFSYEINVKPNEENEITVVAKGSDGRLDMGVEIEGERTVVSENADGKKEIAIRYFAKEKIARIRIDRTSAYTPFVYEIKVK